MPERTALRSSTVGKVYVILALFIAIILCLVVLLQLQMDAMVAVRAFVGGEGLWAKAQKDAVRSLEHYALSRDEADYREFLRLLRVPLGDMRARQELQKERPDLRVAREGFLEGRNHPADMDCGIAYFRRFQRVRRFSHVIEHWTSGDRLISDLAGAAAAFHGEVVSGRAGPETVRAFQSRLDILNRKLTEEEDQFSSTLADASRWAADVARRVTYAIAFLFAVLGLALSWPIVARIRLTERAIVESELRYRSIFENVDDIIFTTESDGTLSSISPSSERMLGWPPGELTGRPFLPFVHPDDQPRIQELFQKALAGEPLPVFRARLLAKAGGYIDTENTSTPVRHGDTLTIFGVIRDITERQRAEAGVQRLNEELEEKVQERTAQLLAAQDELVLKERLAVLGQLAGSVGNELRNPLAVMNNAVYYLQTVLSDADATTLEYLGIITDEIAAADRIVSDLLDSVSTQLPRPATVGVAELVSSALSKCVFPPSISVAVDVPTTLPSILVDPLQLRQVLRNLIANGVEAMPDGGTLKIRGTQDVEAGTVTVTTRDNGMGIAPENLGRLFQPLFTTKARGIGLGLVGVKKLTEANGGTIQVETEPGKGTSIGLTFRRVDPQD